MDGKLPFRDWGIHKVYEFSSMEYSRLDVTGLKINVCSRSDRYGLEVRPGTIEDILDYKTAGTDCSRMLVQSIYLQLRALWIYND